MDQYFNRISVGAFDQPPGAASSSDMFLENSFEIPASPPHQDNFPGALLNAFPQNDDLVDLYEKLESLKIFSNTGFECLVSHRKELIKKIRSPRSDFEKSFISLIKFDNKILKILLTKGRGDQALQIQTVKDKLVCFDFDLFEKTMAKKASFETYKAMFQFIYEQKTFRLPSDLCDSFISLHSNQPETFILVATIKFARTLSNELARAYLLQGLTIHKDNTDLFTNLLGIELDLAECKRNEFSGRDPNHLDDSLKHIVTGKHIKAIFEYAKKNIPCTESNLNFYKSMVEECQPYRWLDAIRKDIIKSILKTCPQSELWHDLYARSLRRSDNQGNFFNEFSAVCDHYAMVLGLIEYSQERDGEFLENISLNNETMWNYALNYLFEIRNEGSAYEAALEPKLEMFLKNAFEAKKISLSHLLQWKRILQMKTVNNFDNDVEDMAQIEKLMDYAFSNPNHNKQMELWKDRYLSLLEKPASVNEFYDFFMDGIRVMEDKAIPMYEIAFQYFNLRDRQKLLDFYELGSESSAYEEVCIHVRCLFLEYQAAENNTLKETKTFYNKYREKKPFSIKFHNTMYDILASHIINDVVPDSFKNAMEECRTCAIIQFGATNPDVWIDLIKHDINYNFSKKVDLYCEKAHIGLSRSPEIRSDFEKNLFNLKKTIVSNESREIL